MEIKKENVLAAYETARQTGADGIMKVLEKLFGEETFKHKGITYEDVTSVLFNDKCYRIGLDGVINFCDLNVSYPDRGGSIKQLEKLLAINKLMNVARYVNGGWKPDWNNKNEAKFYLLLHKDEIGCSSAFTNNAEITHFISKEAARQAVDILGEDTIRLALSTDW